MQHFPAWRIEAHVAAALWIGLALFLAPRVHAGETPASEPSDVYGHLALGTGMSVQYDGTNTTPLGLATWTWDDDHYELAAFRFLTAQRRIGETLARPNWAFELSRRWRLNCSLIDRSGLQLFVGAGAAYKTETDELNGSRLNFAEQFGWRFPRQENGGQVEFAIRHVSNAGFKKPNKGQDFLTLAYVF
jgi:Lipid A 3-O-deacylase (PagL)